MPCLVKTDELLALMQQLSDHWVPTCGCIEDQGTEEFASLQDATLNELRRVESTVRLDRDWKTVALHL